jgi:hypothetical protein
VATDRITQIPLPGGSAHVQTGAMQFQDDWPGLFVRGDDAIFMMNSIRFLAERLADHPDMVIGSAIDRLQQLADIIDQDVVVRKS